MGVGAWICLACYGWVYGTCLQSRLLVLTCVCMWTVKDRFKGNSKYDASFERPISIARQSKVDVRNWFVSKEASSGEKKRRKEGQKKILMTFKLGKRSAKILQKPACYWNDNKLTEKYPKLATLAFKARLAQLPHARLPSSWHGLLHTMSTPYEDDR